MENTIKRPISVWIAQVFLFITSLLMVALLIVNIVSRADSLGPPGVFAILVAMLFPLFFFSLFFVAFWGLQRRKRWGRYLATLILLFAWIIAVRELIFVINIVRINEISPSWTDIPFIFFIPAVVAMLLLPLVANLIFSKKVASFFAQIIEEPVVNSPLPPSFDA